MRLRNSARKRIRRRVPQLNTVATADISFMLLIFFLLTTSMNKEQGLASQLPPLEIQDNTIPTNVDSRCVLTITITPDSRYMAGENILSEEELGQHIEEFIQRIGKDHILELKAHSTANYDAYFTLQNIIVDTYRNLRNAEALRLHKKNMTECSEEQQQSIRNSIPQHITEEFINF